jgi:formate dehydrogenase
MKIFTKDKDTIKKLNNLSQNLTITDNKHEANIIISGQFNKEDYHDTLHAVIIPYTGHDGIDIETLKHHNVKLFNTTVHSKFVAEKAMQLALSLLGNIPNYHNNLKDGDWSKRMTKNRTPWVSMFNMHIGIYGYGRIGKYIHDMVKPFNTVVHVIDRGKDYHNVITEPSLESLMNHSDILFIAAPLTTHTEDAINLSNIKYLKNKYVINVGRGPIINEDALYQALKTKLLKGFASDVWYQYPSKDTPTTHPSIHPIHTFSNVVLSPHCGGHTTQSKLYMTDRVVEHVNNILNNNLDDALDLTKLTR